MTKRHDKDVCDRNERKDKYSKCKKEDRCQEMDIFEYLKKLNKKYRKIEDEADEKFEKALNDLCCAIDNLEDGIELNCDGNKILMKISKLIKKCMDCDFDDCKFEELYNKFKCLVEERQNLEDESLKLAKKAADKLAKARELDECLNEIQCELLDEIKENCNSKDDKCKKHDSCEKHDKCKKYR